MRTLFLAVVATLLAACATTKLEKPRLQVVNVEMLGGNLLQQQLRVRMKVINPNDRELAVRGVTCEVQVAGENFAQGASANAFTVPALGETEFNVNVSANAAAAVLRLLGGSAKLDDVEYRVTGKVQLASGLLRTLPFDHTGRFRLR